MKLRLHFLLLAAALLAGTGLAAERIPPAPPRYFNDYAGVVSRPVADRLNAQLEQFERTNSSQLLVVLYPKMESDSSVEDYTVRVAQAWQAGQAGKNNGAVLFSFMQEHQLYLQVGYGLEGAIPDAIAKRIIEREIVPRFRAGDIDGGMTAAVNAMMAATKGEYQGTGRTVAETTSNMSSTFRGGIIFLCAIIIIPLIFFLMVREVMRRPTVMINPNRRIGGNTNTWGTTGGGSSDNSSWGGGSSWGSGGGGGFSGGGGSFGGGGAGGKW